MASGVVSNPEWPAEDEDGNTLSGKDDAVKKRMKYQKGKSTMTQVEGQPAGHYEL